MDHAPTLKTAMTAFPFSIDEERGIDEAVAMMEEHGIGHLPVTRRGEVVGVVSDSDLRVALALNAGLPEPGPLPVRLLCEGEPYVVDLGTPLEEVVLEMAERQIGSVIVTRAQKLAGILTNTDVCRLLAELLRERRPPDEVA